MRTNFIAILIPLVLLRLIKRTFVLARSSYKMHESFETKTLLHALKTHVILSYTKSFNLLLKGKVQLSILRTLRYNNANIFLLSIQTSLV